MNNINGFTSALLSTSQFSTPDSTKGQDGAATGGASNGFDDVLAGLSQRSDHQQASSTALKTNGWKALGNDMFSGSTALDAGDPAAERGEATSGAAALAKNSTQPPAPARPSTNANPQSSAASTLSRAMDNAAGSLESRQAESENDSDLSAPAPGAGSPDNESSGSPKPAASPAVKVVRPVPAQVPAPAKTSANVQPSALAASRQRQAAASSVETAASVTVSSGLSGASEAGQPTGQTGSSSSSGNADRRRRTESESDQPAAAPNADAQQAGAIAMSIMVPVAPSGATNAGSQTSARETDGLPGAHADPATAILSAIDEPDSEQKAPEELGAPIKLDAVSQTTHFAPVAWLSPTQQIVDATATALSSQSTLDTGSGASATPAAASSSILHGVDVKAQASASSLKTLDLQLDPQDLGAVSVKLHLSSTGLTVEVQASQASTADLLEKDKRALSDGLNGAGYTVSGVEISVASSSGMATTGFTDQGAPQNSFSQSWSGDSQGNRGSQPQDGANDSFPRQNSNQNGHGNPETARSAAQRSAGTGLYI